MEFKAQKHLFLLTMNSLPFLFFHDISGLSGTSVRQSAVFLDPLAYIFDDEWHSVGERREIIIGHDRKNRLLLVCFTERNQIIRIISASLATKKERQDYEKYT